MRNRYTQSTLRDVVTGQVTAPTTGTGFRSNLSGEHACKDVHSVLSWPTNQHGGADYAAGRLVPSSVPDLEQGGSARNRLGNSVTHLAGCSNPC